jgi:hypothetical protein
MPRINPGASVRACVLAITVICAGCSTYNLKLKPVTDYQNVERVNLEVVLVLENEFSGGTLYEAHGLRHVKFRAKGSALADSAKALTSAVFREVQVVNQSPGASAVAPSVGAIVKPHVVKGVFESNKGLGGIIIQMQWTVTKTNGDIVWQKTFRGEQTGSLAPSHDVQKIVDEIFPAAFKSMSEAPAIRALAVSRQ